MIEIEIGIAIEIEMTWDLDRKTGVYRLAIPIAIAISNPIKRKS